jgi:hypothetical protein
MEPEVEVEVEEGVEVEVELAPELGLDFHDPVVGGPDADSDSGEDLDAHSWRSASPA